MCCCFLFNAHLMFKKSCWPVESCEQCGKKVETNWRDRWETVVPGPGQVGLLAFCLKEIGKFPAFEKCRSSSAIRWGREGEPEAEFGACRPCREEPNIFYRAHDGQKAPPAKELKPHCTKCKSNLKKQVGPAQNGG